ncbi:hypothetical protein V6N13_072511, partial [Hibiscus sabdariffa]
RLNSLSRPFIGGDPRTNGFCNDGGGLSASNALNSCPKIRGT